MAIASSAGGEELSVHGIPLKIAYFVHDLNDAAVARRVTLFSAGGAAVELAGFFRRDCISDLAGRPAVSLGRSGDGQFGRRLALLVRNLVARSKALHVAQRADAIVARNLEMLALASRLRRKGQPLIYECLDIHRLMLRDDRLGAILRRAERALLDQCDLLLTSSPAYLSHYFEAKQGWSGPSVLVENKILDLEQDRAPPTGLPPGPPWRIGWFGMLRDAKSLAMLKRLVQQSDGTVQVLLAGRPVERELPDLEREISETPGFEFAGSYTSRDLHSLYGQVHFAWCVDFFEEGANANWSMANRQYESVAHGAVPIGQSQVETGRWLESLGIGVRLRSLPDDLSRFLATLQPEQYLQLRRAVRAVPEGRVKSDRAECRAIVERIALLV